jgi:hypothetical protein
MRPIGLFEITRKVWTSLLMQRIQTVWEKHNLLQFNQHGFRKRNGTESAILRLIDCIEHTRMANSDLYIISWDIRRAFDSIPKNLVKLAWARLGVPLDVVKWLSDLDHDGLTFPWIPHMMSQCMLILMPNWPKITIISLHLPT